MEKKNQPKNSCYYCHKKVDIGYFCNDDCKNKYWKGREVKARPSISEIQKKLVEMGKEAGNRNKNTPKEDVVQMTDRIFNDY